MKILSIDTSSKICAVAILQDENLIKENLIDNGQTHSEKLMPMIKEILTCTELSLKDIDLIVCDKGPGSFTGIRIGIATVKAFADSLNIPCIGISSLEALCFNVKTNGLICSMIDARNENVYWSCFENKNGKYILKHEFAVDSLDSVLETLTNYNTPITFVGDASVCYHEKITQVLPNSIFCLQNGLSAYNLGLAGLTKFKNNQMEDFMPLYIRKPQAEQMLEARLNESK